MLAYTYAESSSVRNRCVLLDDLFNKYEGWNFNSGNYLFTTDTK